MIYKVYVVFGSDRNLVAATCNPWDVYEIASLVERFPTCHEVIIKCFDDEENNK